MAPPSRWVLFDADNTLWQIESLYDDARTELGQFLATRFGIEPAQAEDYQQNRDRDLFQIYGYSTARFPQSFEDTLLYFVPSAFPQSIAHVRALATRVFDRPAIPFDGVEQTLAALRNDFALALITSGDAPLQAKRVGEFPYTSFFTKTVIVPSKSTAVFEQFCDDNCVWRARSWLVGDSIRSDVIPGYEAGLSTILVLNRHWAVVESVGLNVPTSTVVVNKITDIIPIILDARVGHQGTSARIGWTSAI